jgi:hypothetical protein
MEECCGSQENDRLQGALREMDLRLYGYSLANREGIAGSEPGRLPILRSFKTGAAFCATESL